MSMWHKTLKFGKIQKSQSCRDQTRRNSWLLRLKKVYWILGHSQKWYSRKKHITHDKHEVWSLLWRSRITIFYDKIKGKSREKRIFYAPLFGPVGLIIEIKTRTLNSKGQLRSLEKFPSYFIQTQVQIPCKNVSFCILLSYHPETESGNFFLIQKINV